MRNNKEKEKRKGACVSYICVAKVCVVCVCVCGRGIFFGLCSLGGK